jgi:glucose/mannose-6-phosphate isomerase
MSEGGTTATSTAGELSREAIAAVDPSDQLSDVLALPEHLRDAVWRVESAIMQDFDTEDGLVVAGMGGSAIGGALARAALGDHASRPIFVTRAYGLPTWTTPNTMVLCASYSGETEETLACARQAHRQGADLLIVGSGGALVGLAQEWGVAYARVPDALATGPRTALGYLFGAMAGAFGACGLASEGIASAAAEGVEAVDSALARELGERLADTIPLIYGAGPMGAVAYRWKTQMNENAKMHAFSHALPELAHNEIVGWQGAPPGRFAAVLLSDPGQDAAVHRSIAATADLIAADAAVVEVVEGRGATPAARAFSLVAQGDWASYGAALRRGVDPTPVANIDTLKRALRG